MEIQKCKLLLLLPTAINIFGFINTFNYYLFDYFQELDCLVINKFFSEFHNNQIMYC